MDQKADTLIVRWWESNISYNLHFGAAKTSFNMTLYAEDDVDMMLQKMNEDSAAFFSIWLLLYRVCTKLKESLAQHPLFLPDFKCYPTFFDHSEYHEAYSNFALKHKDLDPDEYIKRADKELEKPDFF